MSDPHKRTPQAQVISRCHRDMRRRRRVSRARELSSGGLVSTMIEERDLIGRRIFTVHDSNFAFPVEPAA